MPHLRLAVTAALLGLAAGVLAVTGPAASAAPPATLTGRLEVVHEDRFDLGRAEHRYTLVDSAGRRTTLLFDDDGPHGLGARAVRVTGSPAGRGVLDVGTSTAVTTSDTTGAAVTPTTTKRVAVLLYDFADSSDDARPVDAARARAAVFGGTETPSVNGFLGESSSSRLQMVGATGPAGDVFDWVRISARSTDACAYTTWGQQARSLAAEQGFVDSAYDQVVHVMPKSTCGFGGVAYMPGKYSWTVLRQKDSPNVDSRLRGITSHEYGHNLGIHHSGSAVCTTRSGTVVTLGTCSDRREYGDPFSVMGSSLNERQYTGYQKGRLSWLGTGEVVTATASGTHVLSTASAPGAGPRVLRVASPKVKGSSGFYYVELRTASGTFDAASTAPGELGTTEPVALPPVDGVHVRHAPDFGVNAVSDLYDMTPGSDGGFTDAALPVGDTFSAPAAGLKVTVLSRDAEAGTASVQVVLGSTSPSGKPRK